MSMEDIVRLCGIPDHNTGSGIYIFIYDLNDGSKIRIGTPDLKQLYYVRVDSNDGKSADLLKK